MTFEITPGTPDDVPALLALIKELALYEKAPHEVINTEAQLLADGFGEKPLYGFYVAKVKEQTVGMALYYYRYSTWKGKVLYLEDLYVKPEYRRLKIGKALFERIRQHAIANHCRRISWQVLHWNEPAIQFYKQLGAVFDAEWLNGFIDC
ncbi:MAG: GNAT family N-acetyltransferase [Microscillaceae bacterium]|nr:GNAT family N-acetyltransferase [Microscillaceae bacterium]MDW8460095.1 GNAT family N-acetyltransferase [Cytophagales bacterium]